MIGRREAWVRRWWAGEAGFGGAVATLLTFKLEWSFRFIVALREMSYRYRLRTRHSSPIPVISVGNLTVGGTGKTPISAWIIDELLALGKDPALISRGYGRDEVALHERWHPQIPQYLSRARWRGVALAARHGASVAVLDDGFQHFSVQRHLDLVLVAAEQPFPGHMLPRGPFREPASALRRASAVVVTFKSAGSEQVRDTVERVRSAAPGIPIMVARLGPAGWVTLDGETRLQAPAHPTLATCSIGSPESFFELVEAEVGKPSQTLAFPDHFDFSEADARDLRKRAGGGTILITEKDAVKLADFQHVLGDVGVLRLGVELVEGRDALIEMITRVSAQEELQA